MSRWFPTVAGGVLVASVCSVAVVAQRPEPGPARQVPGPDAASAAPGAPTSRNAAAPLTPLTQAAIDKAAPIRGRRTPGARRREARRAEKPRSYRPDAPRARQQSGPDRVRAERGVSGQVRAQGRVPR